MAFSNADMIDVILSMNNVLVMYWDVHHGWKIVNGNSMFFSGMESIPNALEGLSQYVQEEDKATYSVFRRKIEAGMKGSESFVPVKEERLNVSVHMNAQGDIYSYHKTEH